MTDFIIESLEPKKEDNQEIKENKYSDFLDKAVDFFEKGKRFVFPVFILAVVLALLFIFTLGSNGFRNSKVVLSVDVPQQVSSGEEVTYKVTYFNNSKTSLRNARIYFSYPADSIPLKDGAPVKITNEVVDVGNIGVGDKGEIEFNAILIGDVGTKKVGLVSMNFIPSNLASEFRVEAEGVSEINKLLIPLDLVAPPSLINGQAFSYIIDYKNDSNDDISDIRIVVDYPDGFKVSKSTPRPTTDVSQFSNQAVWVIPVLRPGNRERITIDGSISGRDREGKKITVTVQRKIDIEGVFSYVDFEKITNSSTISTPPLSVSVKLNNSKDYIAKAGETLNYTVDFQNISNDDLSGVTLSALLEGNMFVLNSVKSDGFFDSRLNTVVWNSSSVPQLGILRANQKGTATFSVRLKDSFTGTGLDTSNSLVKVTGILETSTVPSYFGVPRLLSEDEIVTRISTKPTFSQSANHIDGLWGTIGPVPPVVDQNTAYNIKWSLVNPINQVANIRIIATLEPGVAWTGKTRTNISGVSAPAFDPQTSRVTWNVENLPGGVGTTTPSYDAFFQVSITPSTNQIGSNMSLIREVSFEGVDVLTNETITLRANNITTSTINDSPGQGNIKAQ